MPIATTRDDEQRSFTVTITDPWSVEEVAVALDRQVDPRTWSFGTLYDLRGTLWIPSEPDLLWLVKHGQQQVARHGARGPVAVLIDGTEHSLELQRYAEYGGEASHVRLRVFTDQDAAIAWLAAVRDADQPPSS